MTLVAARLCEPSSELHLAEHFYASSALIDLLEGLDLDGETVDLADQQIGFVAVGSECGHVSLLGSYDVGYGSYVYRINLLYQITTNENGN